MFHKSPHDLPSGNRGKAPKKRKASKPTDRRADAVGQVFFGDRSTVRERGEATNSMADAPAGFGGLAALRKLGKDGYLKVVRVEDPFQGGRLHFPLPLACENWLVSCFGRSLNCTVPTSPMVVLDHGRVLQARAALVLQTSGQPIADFVVKHHDAKSDEAWRQFQVIARAHGFQPELRTIEHIRRHPLRIRNLDTMRSHLVEHIRDIRFQLATPLVAQFVREQGHTTMRELCMAISHDQLPAEAVECAAIQLYRFGLIDLNVSEASYGPRTILQLL